MRTGAYLFFALIFTLLVGGIVYMINPGTYSFDIFGVHMPALPVAVWVMAPVLLLVIFSFLHMLYYGAKSFFGYRKWYRDANELEDALYWAMVQEPKEHTFVVDDIAKSANLLNVSVLNVKRIVQPLSSKLSKTLEWIKEIENGGYVDLKAKKVEKNLSKNNPLLIKNYINRLEKDESFLNEVLEFSDRFAPEVLEKAYDILVEKKDIFTIKKYAKEIGKERFFKLLNRLKDSKNLKVTSSIFEYFMNQYELNCQEFLKVAKIAVKVLNPDDVIAIFQKIQNENELAQSAYLYILFEYELLDKVKSFLEEHDEDEFRSFRALLILKRNRYSFKVDEIISEDNACR
ncbi:MAG: hypothetical protein GXO02_01040 [Epsilonproteobacteria bacterium]|nr:hypothetical protein [Campylobacterota bacterium]